LRKYIIAHWRSSCYHGSAVTLLGGSVPYQGSMDGNVTEYAS